MTLTHTELERAFTLWEPMYLFTLKEEPKRATDVPEEMKAVLSQTYLTGWLLDYHLQGIWITPLSSNLGTPPPHSAINLLSASQLDQLRNQIDDLLRKRFIRPSVSPYGAPILFVKKKRGEIYSLTSSQGNIFLDATMWWQML